MVFERFKKRVIQFLMASPYIFLIVLGGLGLYGCASRTVEPRTEMSELPETFSRSGSDTVPERWWTTLGDTHLNKLIDRALKNNFSLKQAWNRLSEARAVVTSQSSDLYPGLDVTGTRKIEERETERNTTQRTETSQLQAVASYEVDLWNRIESSVEAARYQRRATRQELQSAAISLSAEVARTWYQLIESYSQIRILRDQLEVNRELYRLVENRYGHGQTALANVLRQRRLRQGTDERLTTAKSRARTLEHKLAVLLGEAPTNSVTDNPPGFPELPAIPETGIPSRSINQRPDVKASFHKIHSADRNVASAIANQYPRINVTASLSTSGADAGTLFQNWLSSLAGDVTAPIIDARKREAEVRRTEAVLSRRVNSYRETVLNAFKEVEDALVEEQKKRKQFTEINDQLKTATQTVEVLRNKYVNGTIDFLEVLEAIQTKQELERSRESARRAMVIDRIGLYRALSGGWSMDRPDKEITQTNTGGD